MRKLAKSILGLPIGLALTAGSAPASAGQEDRALSLLVVERSGEVELEVIGNSQIAQTVEFSVELTGSSTARHHSSTSLAAGSRQVLSRFKTSFADTWCARVEVTESSGASYTLTAGDC